MSSTLTIAAEANPETNQAQARLMVDGQDWLGPERAGLEPPMLRGELLDKGVGSLIVGRCWCGGIGCNDLVVEVTRAEGEVHWSAPGGINLRFDAAEYDAEVARFAEDTSWETLERRVGREVGDIFRGTSISGGFEFEWALPSRSRRLVRLYFRNGDRQKSLKFGWDGASVADAVNRARLYRAERFSHCS